MNKVIAFDMDDVLVELLNTWLDVLNRHHNLKVKKEDVVDWDMKLAYPTLNEHQIYECLGAPYFWKEVEKKDNGPEVVQRFIDDGYKVVVVTAARPESIATKLNKCLFKHYPMLSYKDIIMAHQKDLINCDYIVDDGPHNLKNHKAIKFLMDAPYNKNCDKIIYDFRVKNLEEVYSIIKEIENV